jgi:hypothetical protein
MLPRNLRPIRLSRRPEPFDSDEHIYELNIDGFRALAYIEADQGQLISRNLSHHEIVRQMFQRSSEHILGITSRRAMPFSENNDLT